MKYVLAGGDNVRQKEQNCTAVRRPRTALQHHAAIRLYTRSIFIPTRRIYKTFLYTTAADSFGSGYGVARCGGGIRESGNNLSAEVSNPILKSPRDRLIEFAGVGVRRENEDARIIRASALTSTGGHYFRGSSSRDNATRQFSVRLRRAESFAVHRMLIMEN